jgi:hypothetical protein
MVVSRPRIPKFRGVSTEPGVIVFFGYQEVIYGIARLPATECPCKAGPDLDHWDICREATETTIDLEHPVTHFACEANLSVDELIGLAKLELDAVAIDRKKAN